TSTRTSREGSPRPPAAPSPFPTRTSPAVGDGPPEIDRRRALPLWPPGRRACPARGRADGAGGSFLPAGRGERRPLRGGLPPHAADDEGLARVCGPAHAAPSRLPAGREADDGAH